jgi:hypothetical protein
VEDNNHLPHLALDLSLRPSPAFAAASSSFNQERSLIASRSRGYDPL